MKRQTKSQEDELIEKDCQYSWGYKFDASHIMSKYVKTSGPK